MTPPNIPCETPGALCTLGQLLPNFARALRGQVEVNIVAIGSSSTEGDGASSPAASYPSRLGIALAARFPTPKINVLNLGVGGQEAPDEAARFKRDVLANRPALVIWQVYQRGVEGLFLGRRTECYFERP
jgi:acyl-CoA thioesterase-1